MKSASAFIDFKHYRDAQHAIRDRDKYEFDGYPLRVAFSYRVIVSNLPLGYEWQDLKKSMSRAGNVVYADVGKDGDGVVDFSRREDAEYAISSMNKTELKSSSSTTTIRVAASKEHERLSHVQSATSSTNGKLHINMPSNLHRILHFYLRTRYSFVWQCLDHHCLVPLAKAKAKAKPVAEAAERSAASAPPLAIASAQSAVKGRRQFLHSPAFSNHMVSYSFECRTFQLFHPFIVLFWAMSFDTHPLEVTHPQQSFVHGGQTSAGTSSSGSGMGAGFTLSVQNCQNFRRGAEACAENLLVDIAETVTGAMEQIKQRVDLETSESGDTRVLPMVYSRLGRGGKSTFLWCLFRALKADGFSPIHISFNGGFLRGNRETQLSALLRLLGSEFMDSSSVATQSPVFSARSVIDHIERTSGGSKAVLLIDDLDVLAGGPMDADTTSFLKKEFLDKAGRYLVFTSRIPLNVDEAKADELSEFFQYRTASPRGLISVHQPHSVDLTELRKMPGCAALTSAEVTIYGGIPSLIYSFKGRDRYTPRERVQLQDIQLPKKHQNRLLGEFIYEVLEGTRLHEHNHWSYSFASTPKYGIVWWPLCYIAGILQLFQRKIAHIPFDALVKRHLAASGTSLVTSDVDWELLVQAALMLRCIDAMVNYSRGPFGIAEFGITRRRMSLSGE